MGAGKSPRRRREKQFHNKEQKTHEKFEATCSPPSPPSRPTFLKRWPVLQRQAPLREESRLLKDPPRSIFPGELPQPLTCFLSGSKLSSEKPLPFFSVSRGEEEEEVEEKKKEGKHPGVLFWAAAGCSGPLHAPAQTGLLHSAAPLVLLSALCSLPLSFPFSVCGHPPPSSRSASHHVISPHIQLFPSSFCLFEANMWGLMYTGTHSHTHQLTGTPLKSLIPT